MILLPVLNQQICPILINIHYIMYVNIYGDTIENNMYYQCVPRSSSTYGWNNIDTTFVPDSSEEYNNIIYRYIGETYETGKIYQNRKIGDGYIWENVEIDDIPEAEPDVFKYIYKFIEKSNEQFEKNHFYKCVLDVGNEDADINVLISAGLPPASEELVNTVYKYTGNTIYSSTEENPRYYQCVAPNEPITNNSENNSNNLTYEWREVTLSEGQSYDNFNYIPEPTESYKNTILHYTGNINIEQDNYYAVISGNNTYVWKLAHFKWKEYTNNISNKFCLSGATLENLYDIYKYTGNLISGNIYKCLSSDVDNYNWKDITLQFVYKEVTILPETKSDILYQIYKYDGETNYISGNYYQCQLKSTTNNIHSDVYQSQVTDGTLYNFPSINVGNDIKIDNDFTNKYTYISGLYDNTLLRWSSLFINGGDRTYFDLNLSNFVNDNLKEYHFYHLNKTLADSLPKDLNGISAYFHIYDKYVEETDPNSNIKFYEDTCVFKNITNGYIILSGEIIDNKLPELSSSIQFEGCNCNILIKDVAFNNCLYNMTNYKQYEEFKYISNLNIINCNSVNIENVKFKGQNYRDSDITTGWYKPYTYTEESQSGVLYNDMFVYNSNVNISGITFTNSGIGIYNTVNSKVNINGNVKFNNDPVSNITFKKRQVVTFTTRNSITNLNTGDIQIENSQILPESDTNLYYNDNPVYDTHILSGYLYEDDVIGSRILRTDSVPIIYGLHDVCSIYNHNHIDISPNTNITFETLSGNLPNGSIYFQGSYDDLTAFDTVLSNWNFNIAKNIEISADVNNNKIISLTTNDNYLLILKNNIYNVNTYSNISDVYLYMNDSSDSTKISFPLINIHAENAVIPTIKNFDYYAGLNEKEYKK